ncbi:phosphate transport system substrate-binding protein [Bradyrhizobium sp. i1.8.4]|uniref:substrate-binding domain-containing protein n=1 Tax=unclassified Bradyrhizobium TaxID=2631580 RepID=UPI003D25CFDF
MKMQSSKYMLGTASVLALLASSTITPANAQVSTATAGIYAGGSTLASEAFRQIFDCYMGATVGFGTTYPDGFAFSPTSGPGKLPTTCTLVSVPMQGMYAGVGSGNGVRGFISNNPQQWYNGTVTPGTSGAPPLPANQPAMIDLANPGTPATKFGSYPYPRVDIGLSDSPLAGALASLTTSSVSFNPTQSWTTTGGALATVTVNSTFTASVAYNTTVYGNPIQIPAFEVNVAIGVNTSTMTVNSAVAGTGATPGTQANQGAAIQLSTAQMCAIFTGLVTDWNDVTANKIPYLNNAGTQVLAAFDYTNANSSGTLQAYSSTSLPIKIVYRGDGSGTSFILTNYLKAVCPLLDSTGAFGYQSIFNTTTLPSTTFANLITRIAAVRGTGGWNNTTATNAWISATGSGGVASAISTDAANKGRIGYVSADFTQPYTTQVGTIAAPRSAALQNEQLRVAGTYVPNNATPTTLEFIAPTPDGANAAWLDTRLRTPATTWTWNDYNIYANVFGTVTQGGVTMTGLPVLPLTNRSNAYPLSGTTFLDLYSCYNVQADTGRVTNLVRFLTWYYAGAGADGDPDVAAVIQNAGFHHLTPAYATNIQKQYWNNATTDITAAAAAQVNGCLNVANGASGGAK